MKNKILTLILLASALCPGCSGWLDVKPYDQISEEELLESEEGFQKLLNGIYIELNSDELYGSTLSVEMIEILGGAYEIGDNSSVWGDYLDLKDYDYNTDYWRGRLNGTWNKAYALILNCNKLLKNIQGRQALFTGHNYDIIRGEALALRAMLHFDMLRLFGPVYSLNPDGTSIPYYADETLTPEALLPASQVVYKVLQDLMAARAALLNDPVITEGTLMSSAGNGSNFLRYRALRLNYYAVSALLARAAEPFAIGMELRGQQLQVEASGNVRCDPAWTAEALGNILKNCSEHMQEGTITVRAEENAVASVVVIRDTGGGIAPQDLPHLFERYYKGENAPEQSVGIGLALSRSIAAAQNGTLTAANVPGGAEFTMKLYKGIV